MKKKLNFYDLIPVQNRETVTLENGNVAILQPRFFNDFVKNIMRPYLKSETVQVKLDREGTFTWNMCDGKRNMAEIVELFNKEFECEDGADRIKQFMAYLERCEIIYYSNLKELQAKN